MVVETSSPSEGITAMSNCDNTSSVTGSFDLHEADDSYAVKVLPSIIINTTVLLVGLVSSSLVFYVYLTRLKPNVTRYCIRTMASLDVLTCSVGLPFEIADLRHYHTLGQYSICNVFRAIINFGTIASGFVLLFVAVERFRNVCLPSKTGITILQSKVTLTIICLITAAFSVPVLFIYGPSVPVDENHITNSTGCGVALTHFGKILFLSDLILLFFTVLILIVLYSMIWYRVSRHTKDMLSGMCSHDDSSPTNCKISRLTVYRSTKRRIIFVQRVTTRTLFLITLAFVLTYSPHVAIRMMRAMDQGIFENMGTFETNIYHILLRSTYAQGVFNFIIYSACQSSFRKHMKRLISRKS